MSVKNIFFKLLKSKKKTIKKQEDAINDFKAYIEKEWSFLTEYGLKLKYNDFHDAEFYSKDERYCFIINFNTKPKYKRRDLLGFYKTFETNSIKKFIDDMIDFI